MVADKLTRTKVLITVMTYPHPSRGYDELVCTAGITEAGEWVRLYPIDYRYRPTNQQFHKYQWIEIELESRGKGSDNRKESRKPNLDSIVILGPQLSTDNAWEARAKVVECMPVHTINQLRKMHEFDKTSLGIVKPVRILDIDVEETDREWKAEWQLLYDQLRLFGPPPKPLR